MPIAERSERNADIPVRRADEGKDRFTFSGSGQECSRSVNEQEESQSLLTSVAAAMEKDWLLWQLADSAFPSGGFAHSSGLEAAWQNGEVRNRVELASFFEASLHQFGSGTLPFVTAAHDEPEKLAELDGLCDKFTTNHVANRASRLQGRAFLASTERIFGSPTLFTPHGHFAPVFGAVTNSLELNRANAAQLFFFQHLRGLVAGAVRLGIVGPMEAQALQYRLGPRAQEILSRCENLDVTEIAQTAPLMELWQGTQDRLYSRLFQS